MPDFDPASIRDALRRLKAAGSTIFGANGHHFTLNPPLTEADVQAFERQHAITLPTDYRRFLIEIGNGGAGPTYGIFPLGLFDGSGASLEPWGDFVGTLAEPFAHREPWNDLTGSPDNALEDTDEDEYWRRVTAFEARYYSASVMNGALPICTIGCALRIWLVVTGEEAGRVWYDYRADYRGIGPEITRDGIPATFGAWYMEWLEEALRKIRA